MYQEIKPIECSNGNPSGSDRNFPTVFNPSFSTPSMNTNSNENAFLAYNYGMQSNFLTSVQAMQQSYNYSTLAMQQAYLAYLNSNKK